MMYCCRAASILRSFNSGCENANCSPDWTSGSKLLMGLLLVVRDASHDTFQVPEPHGRRCRTPLDENQSPVSTPRVPRNELSGGAVVLDRPSVVEKTGAYALCAS